MDTMLIILSVVAIIQLILLVLILRRPQAEVDTETLFPLFDRLERKLQEQFSRQREDTDRNERALREEIARNFDGISDMIRKELLTFSTSLREFTITVENKLHAYQSSQQTSFKVSTEQFSQTQSAFNESLASKLTTAGDTQSKRLADLTAELGKIVSIIDEKFEQLRSRVEEGLLGIRQSNEKKLEEMRITVDEKLHATLEQRLGERFQLVSAQLKQVHEGLGEMKNLATGVGDLKKVLSGVKTRGNWGEIKLAALIEQVMSPDQYEKNVRLVSGSQEVVEYAIKLPGKTDNPKEVVYLPIDAKFPLEDYQKIIDEQELGNLEQAALYAKALERRFEAEAKKISEKYIHPPVTTDFAVLFLPIEGLYAEAYRSPVLIDKLMREHRVVIAGPSTLAALLNSLQMGFRTLAVEKRSGEVWKLLSEVKKNFTTFGDLLDKTAKKLGEATNTIDDAARKSRTIEKQLSKVQELPASTNELLTEGIPQAETTGGE